jgi:nucleotide-binding universal stress UspA family protein
MPIVVGVDGSEESMRAVEWAARQSRRSGAPLRLVSAAATPPRLREDDWLPAGISLLAGPPAVAVTASSREALMLVVGARGAGGFGGMLLGSVSGYAAMHAQCPVIVVREDASAVRPEVVVGVRDPLDITATLGFAFEEAAVRGASLVAVHVLSRMPAADWRCPDCDELRAGADRNLADALAPWLEKYPGVPVRRDVLHDHPGHVLVSYSGRADLVVIGRQDRGGLSGIQHALLSHAHGPVAVVPHSS